MPFLRFDVTTADWVVFAPLRKLRPQHDINRVTAAAEAPDATASCPFCPGNEKLTPPEIFAIRSLDSDHPSAWKVRVTSNKFPALRIEEDHHHRDDGPIFTEMGGCGAHEVVIESPDHFKTLAQQPVEQIQNVLSAVRARYADLRRDSRFQAIIIFKNHGIGAGTSLKHPHWQIIATPVVPRMLRLKYAEATNYFDRTGNSMYERIVAEELASKTRVIAANRTFLAFVPYAAHVPFEIWILPRSEQIPFAELNGQHLRPLAEILKAVLLKLYVGLEDCDFNLTIDMPPQGDENKGYFPWHVRILPRLATTAGFELGSGMSINTTLPEEAAAYLRNGDAVEI